MRQATFLSRFLYFLFPLMLVMALLFGFLPCPPVLAAPVLSAVPSSGPVGTAVTITGTVFDSYEGDTIYILFDDTEISTIVVPSNGSFTITSSIPAAAAGGQHVIGAKRQTTDSSFFISAPFTVDARGLTLNILEGPVGTDVIISGTGFYVNKSIDLTYNNPNAGIIGTVMASGTGKFTKTFKVPEGIAGSHKFTAANDVGNTAEVAFKVIPDIVLSAASGASGEQITVNGSGFGPRRTVAVTLNTFNIVNSTTDDFGSFEVGFTIPEMAAFTYELKARDVTGNSAAADFRVIAGATLSQATGPVGVPLTVSGSDFKVGSQITVYYDDIPVASAVADGYGDFTVTFTVPAGKSGEHTVSVSDTVTTREYSYTVESVAPPPPSPLLPEHNGITAAYADFRWQDVTDPSVPVAYDIEVASDRDFTDIVLQKTGLAVPRCTLAGEEAIKTSPEDSVYFWRVAAIDGAGNRSAWSQPYAFYVDVPLAPSIKQPAIGESVSFPVSLGWGDVNSLSQPVTYQLQVSRNSEFSQLLIDEKDLASPGYTIPGESKRIFNKKIPYYWRVKAVDNARNSGSWSATGSFNIASTGFPAWATWTLVSFGAVVLAWLIYRFIRRKTYH